MSPVNRFVPQFSPLQELLKHVRVLRRACVRHALRVGSLARVGWSAWSPFRPLG